MSDTLQVIIAIIVVITIYVIVYKIGEKKKSQITTGFLAIFFGWLGLHRVYLGNYILAIFYLIFSCTLIPILISLIEGIVFLSMDKNVFDKKYNKSATIIDIKEVEEQEKSPPRKLEIINLTPEISVKTFDDSDYYSLSQNSYKQQKQNTKISEKDFINIEVAKTVAQSKPNNYSFFFLDDSFMEDIIRFVIEEQSTNKIQGHFGVSYDQQKAIINDLKILKILGEGEYDYNLPLLIKTPRDYEEYKKNYRKLKNNITEKQLKQIEILSAQEIKRIEVYEDKLKQAKEIEIRNKILQQQKEKELQREVKKKMIDEGLIEVSATKQRSRRISQETQDKVWNRDGGKCVECGSSEKLEFDHIVPFSKGGSNTYRNIQLLCETCNRKKSNKIG